ncbi:outer membrane receptor for ferrienterochelin and colicins [Mucilaginibacter oryzae]|uniref:Outer membrane receptor for ferrienterochelin and colicins n=1 Tax=Mucilaginibacter oryzae TaxID=468058 RepID=A0A316HVZ1_9SPHI|nr:TonB-dependent receptor [Mucilaginibacter oryzae]PWK79142.1 outer membrane receptor for ferrienterochelin and colicins [Mucilaginibacter oryzae]
MNKKIVYVLLLLSARVSAQQIDTAVTDTGKVKKLKEVIVTATRSAKELMSVPMPVSTISNKEIKNRGLVRLDEVLNEQTGLSVLPDAHGQGIQVQGFAPDYTMIMLDGMPVIGRTTGILDLTRITTNGVDRIEVVKGPVSSLYGSEAMAGVVNLISARPPLGFSSSVAARYGTNKNADLNFNAAYATDKLSVSGFVNRNSTGGYSLVPGSGSPTVSPYHGYTVNGRITYKLNANTDLLLLIRNYTNTTTNNYSVDSGQVAGKGFESNFSISPSVTRRFSEKLTGQLRLYRSTYRTTSLLNYTATNAIYDDTYFNQAFNRAEVQGDYQAYAKLRLTSGAGGQYETVDATRYDTRQSFTSGYAYMQGDWTPFKKLNLIAGGRFDAHSVYLSQFSPKLALSYRLSDNFVVLGSTGKGYKAPDFRQLYLNFTNAVVGYSVFGYEEVAAQIAKLQQQGQIQTILIDPSTLRPLNAESSTGYNLGYRYRPVKSFMWTVNFFRNNIRDLIDAEAIAIKTNGQSVYSYFNIHSVYTQGAETDLSYHFLTHWTLAGGYQYLQAYDNKVLHQIKAGQVFGIDPKIRETVKVTRQMYGGLLNRSKNMANARISYQDDKTGIVASVRAIYRGRYGFSDLDGNGIVNRDDEYVKGYVLFNASVSKLFYHNQFRFQLTGENLGDYKQPLTISNLPGRLLYVGFTYNFSKQ